MKKSLIAVALAFMSLAPAVQAQPGYTDTSSLSVAYLEVSYADLNLRSSAGANVMLNRIKFAARKVCGGEPDFVDIPMRHFFKGCVLRATDDAVDQLGAPLVTSLYMHDQELNTRLAYVPYDRH